MPMGWKVYLTVFHFTTTLVKEGVASVEILAVQLLLRDAEGVDNTVNMKYYNILKPIIMHF